MPIFFPFSRHESIIKSLYDPTYKKCSNCGLRFPSTDMVAYSLHLDWHFRLKRRERDRAKVAQSRQWYLHTADWNKSDELEESQMDEDDEDEGGSALPTVPASDVAEENSCPICGEEFERFFKQEEDFAKSSEGGIWILRNAIRPEGKQDDPDIIPGRAYHPQCFGDRKNNYNLLEDSAHDVTATNGDAPMENGEVKTEAMEDEVATTVEKEPVPFEIKTEDDESIAPPAVKNEVEEEGGAEEGSKPDDETVKFKAEPQEAAPATEEEQQPPVVKTELEEEQETESAPKEMDTSLDDSAGHLTDMKPPSAAGPATAAGGHQLGGFVINLSR